MIYEKISDYPSIMPKCSMIHKNRQICYFWRGSVSASLSH